MIRARFVQLLAPWGQTHVLALDERGNVWCYRANMSGGPSFWQRLDGDDDRRDFDRNVKGGRS